MNIQCSNEDGEEERKGKLNENKCTSERRSERKLGKVVSDLNHYHAKVKPLSKLKRSSKNKSSMMFQVSIEVKGLT